MSSSIKTIHQSPHPNSFYESLLPITLPDGKNRILLTRQDVPQLWSLDPSSSSSDAAAELLLDLSHSYPSITSLTGLCGPLGGDDEKNKNLYAFGAGQYRVATHEGPVLGSFGVFILDLSSYSHPKVQRVDCSSPGGIEDVGQLNGMCVAPSSSSSPAAAVLIADSYHGKVYRVSFNSMEEEGEIKGKCELVIDGGDQKTLNSPATSPVKMGVNGMKVRWEGRGKEKKKCHLYYTNTTRMLYCRVEIDPETCRAVVGKQAEVLVRGSISREMMEGLDMGMVFKALRGSIVAEEKEGGEEEEGVEGFMPDDFCFVDDEDEDEDGSAYITTHPTNMVMKVSLSNKGNGAVVKKIAGGFKDWEVASATACAFGRGENKDVLYVVTAGCNVIPIEKGKTEGAKVVAIDTAAL